MSRITHTPGPWAIRPTWTGAEEQFAIESYDIVAGPNLNGLYRQIASIDLASDEETARIDRVNARLIAAAPALLKWAKLLEQTILAEIRRDQRDGDQVGVALKRFSLEDLRADIAQVDGGAA